MRDASETIPVADVITVARELFAEAYLGPAPQGSWFVSPRQGAGLFETVGRLTAQRASRPSRPGGPSIAAHVEHLRWTLERVNATVVSDPMLLRGLAALAPHAAYHLGAIRLLAAQQEA